MAFREAREIMRVYMEQNMYASVAWRVNPISQDNK